MAASAHKRSEMPRNDMDLSQWLIATSQAIADQAPGLFIADDQANHLQTLARQFEEAYFAANDPNTRTSHTIALKDQARDQAVAYFRDIIKQIKANPNVTDAALLSIGLRPRADQKRKPRIPAPSTAPILNIVMARDGEHLLQYADSMQPHGRSKPHGVTHLEVFVTICDRPTSLDDPTQATYAGSFTRTPFKVTFKPEADGKVATYYGRWAGRAGKVGPWSLPVSMVVCGTCKPHNVSF